MELQDGWWVRSSAGMTADGSELSRPEFDAGGWHLATVPTTVVAALVADGTYPDPYVGMNLRDMPGTTYPIGANFSNEQMPDDSPFVVPWWFRTEFAAPDLPPGRRAWLRFDGINFAADVWLNGRRLTGDGRLAGPWRIHEFDATDVLRAGEPNALAVAVSAPTPHDLAITFVDWNPTPPDKLMGIHRPVAVTTSGPVTLRHPQVLTDLSPSHDRADLTVKVLATNAVDVPIDGMVRCRIGSIEVVEPVALGPNERRELRLDAPQHPQLTVHDPALWWPAQYGEPRLHDLELTLEVDGAISDRSISRFGIRQVDASIDDAGHLRFEINGQPILIRGAGWSSELLLRTSAERFEQELAYVRHLGLNTVRLEGTLEDDRFFDIADRLGLLVMVGWCCCDHWEKWDEWDSAELPIAVASLRDQILRLRGRASVGAWFYGSDFAPPAEVERAYLEVLDDLEFPNPVVSSATEQVTEVSGPSGVKMRGPYEWVPPIYWYTDTERGGPHGFATEIGPGPSPPPTESLRRFLPEADVWPINDTWDYHCGGGPFGTLDLFNDALAHRYGPPTDLDDYARKAQVTAYESHRAMFEAFGARKYDATGVIQWMLNNAWPSMIWHLYDVYLRPGGSFYGTRLACEPLHIQYSYDDRSVVVVNSTRRAFEGITATARIFDLDSVERHRQSVEVAVAADGVTTALHLPDTSDLGPASFVALTLADGDGIVSRNVYWLSATREELDWEASEWYVTPVARFADLTALADLPGAEVTATLDVERAGAETEMRVALENPSDRIAFFVHLAALADDEEVLPVRWDDNYLTLVPEERRVVTARLATRLVAPTVALSGWNVDRRVIEPAR